MPPLLFPQTSSAFSRSVGEEPNSLAEEAQIIKAARPDLADACDRILKTLGQQNLPVRGELLGGDEMANSLTTGGRKKRVHHPPDSTTRSSRRQVESVTCAAIPSTLA